MGSATWPQVVTANDVSNLATVPAGTGIVFSFVTPPIDLTAVAVTNLLAAMPFRLARISSAIAVASWLIETTSGTLSGDGTFSLGTTSAAFANIMASQSTPAALRTQAAHTYVTIGTSVSPAFAADLTASGLNLNVTAGISGGGTITARVQVCGILVPV